MILLLISAGQGPEECAKAVALAYKRLVQEAQNRNVDVSTLELIEDLHPGCFKSILLKLEGKDASKLAATWHGVMQWICTSPFRPVHKRKNWFFSGKQFDVASETSHCHSDDEIRFKTCRASGAGGQHVTGEGQPDKDLSRGKVCITIVTIESSNAQLQRESYCATLFQ
jgi:peptide chain release factor